MYRQIRRQARSGSAGFISRQQPGGNSTRTSGGEKSQSFKLPGDSNRFQTGQNQSDQGGRNNVGRASGDDVRNFLNMRGNDSARVADNNDKGKSTVDRGKGGDNVQDLFRSRDNGNRDNGGRDNINRDGDNSFRKLGDNANGGNNRFKFDGNKGDRFDGSEQRPGNRDGNNRRDGDKDGKGNDGPIFGNNGPGNRDGKAMATAATATG